MEKLEEKKLFDWCFTFFPLYGQEKWKCFELLHPVVFELSRKREREREKEGWKFKKKISIKSRWKNLFKTKVSKIFSIRKSIKFTVTSFVVFSTGSISGLFKWKIKFHVIALNLSEFLSVSFIFIKISCCLQLLATHEWFLK